jgi:hypothetical protein
MVVHSGQSVRYLEVNANVYTSAGIPPKDT